MNTSATPKVHPLALGHGPHTFEVFIEPTCPFSVKAFNKLPSLLNKIGAENVTIKIRLQSQPWHMYSPVIVRCILAAASLAEGQKSAFAVMQAIADHREEFEFTDHCSGPNMAVTPHQIIERIEQYSGIAIAEAFSRPALNTEVKWHAKYARQNGIHVSPTFMVNGLVQSDLGSGDEIERWIERISL